MKKKTLTTVSIVNLYSIHTEKNQLPFVQASSKTVFGVPTDLPTPLKYRYTFFIHRPSSDPRMLC